MLRKDAARESGTFLKDQGRGGGENTLDRG